MRQSMRKVLFTKQRSQAKEIAALKKRIYKLKEEKVQDLQGRSIEDIDVDVDVSLVDETQERQDDDLMFDTGVLEDDEMHVEAKVDRKDEQSTKPDDITAGISLMIVLLEPSEFRVPQETQPLSSKDKGKGIMIEPEVPLKRKDQIALDEQIARDIQAKLDAELLEEQKLARKQEEEANITLIESWENTQAMMEADRLLAERLQSKERENKEKKEEGREEITKGSRKKMLGRKRVGKEQQKESSKKQRVEEEKESEEVDEINEIDEAELKKLLVIKKDEDIAIDAIPLATKLPVIIDYKLHKEGMLAHYQLIRADGGFKRYSSMIRMLQGIDREDLEAL
ncbi:hypothetical protein Tco_0201677 [Tanacetum coccineum]